EIIHLPWQQDFKLHTDTRCQAHKKEEVEGILSEVGKVAWSNFNGM
ncbi:mCG116891, isoform CRA_b, partial [Mus musculus]